jgi:hypothetical protein
MKKSKIIFLIIGFVVFVSLIALAWLLKGYVTGYVRDVSENYTVRTIAFNGLCATERVSRKNGAHIVTLQVCEDNIESISESDESIIITTSTGRIYNKNKTTGEEVITNARAFGGLSIVKFSL